MHLVLNIQASKQNKTCVVAIKTPENFSDQITFTSQES